MNWTNPLWRLIDVQHILTPIAIERVKAPTERSFVHIRLVYIFGIKVAYFNVSPF